MMGDFWVFGYGSLMWRPGFRFMEEAPARLIGLHRALCVYSHVHRGTPDRPGLVLGLDHGGSCHGIAFRVSGADRKATLEYLREREQTTMVYRETERPVDLLNGSAARIRAICYAVDRTHRQYAGELPLETQISFVLQGQGRSGINVEYVLNTIAHLREMNIHDRRLEGLAKLLLEGQAQESGSAVRGDA